jgi:hypothetical protein
MCATSNDSIGNRCAGIYTLGSVKFKVIYRVIENEVKSKGKFVPVLNKSSTTQLRGHMGKWRYSFTILDLGTRWR